MENQPNNQDTFYTQPLDINLGEPTFAKKEKFIVEAEERDVPDNPGIMESMFSFNATENLLWRGADYLYDKMNGNVPNNDYEEGFSALDAISIEAQENPSLLEDSYFDELLDAKNKSYYDYKLGKLKDGLRHRENFANASFGEKAFGILSGVALDPTMWIGGVTALKTAYRSNTAISSARAAAKGAAALAGVEAAREAGLQALDPARTQYETIANTMAAGIIGGALGGAGGAIASKYQGKGVAEYAKNIRRELIEGDVEVAESIAGVTAKEVLDMSVGAAENKISKSLLERLDDEQIIKLGKLQKMSDKTPEWLQGPYMKLAQSRIPVIREFSDMLIGSPLVKSKHLEMEVAGPSVKSMIEAKDVFADKTRRASESYFHQYNKRIKDGVSPEDTAQIDYHWTMAGKKKRANGALDQQDFDHEVWRAVNGLVDGTPGNHYIPEVAQAAKVHKEALEAAGESAVRAEFFDEDIIDFAYTGPVSINITSAEADMMRRSISEPGIDMATGDKNLIGLLTEDFSRQINEAGDELIEVQEEMVSIKTFVDDAKRELKALKKEIAKTKGKNKLAPLKEEKLELEKKIKAYEGKEGLDTLVKREKVLSRRSSIDKAEAQDLALRFVERVLADAKNRPSYSPDLSAKSSKGTTYKIGKRGSAKARKWGAFGQLERYQKYLNTNMTELSQHYHHGIWRDIELYRKFKALEFDDAKVTRADGSEANIIQEIWDQYQQTAIELEKAAKKLRAEGDIKGAAKLEKQARETIDLKRINKEINMMRDTWNIARGTLLNMDDYNKFGPTLVRILKDLTFAILLPGVLLSSLPDLMRPVVTHGFKDTYGLGLSNILKGNMDLIKKASKEAIDEFASASDITNNLTALRMFNMDEMRVPSNPIEKISAKMAQVTSRLSGIGYWNSAIRTFATVTNSNRILKAILRDSDKMTKADKAYLARHGINEDIMNRIKAQEKHIDKGDLFIANTDKWDDAELREIYAAVIRSSVDEINIRPGLEIPTYFKHPLASILGQFQSFTYASTFRTTLQAYQQRDLAAVMGMLAMTSMGSLTYIAKELSKGNEPDITPEKLLVEGFDRGGFFGALTNINNMMSRASGNQLGLSALLGADEASRAVRKGSIIGQMGPAISLGEKAYGIPQDMLRGEYGKAGAAALQLTPLYYWPPTAALMKQVADDWKNN